MEVDCDDDTFVSSLAIFRSMILYANVSYDHMVFGCTYFIQDFEQLAPSF